MTLEFKKDCISYEEGKLCGALAELSNAVLIVLWEGDEPRWGTTSATLPNRTNAHLLGDREEVLSNVIGDMLATKFKKMVIVSINLIRSKGLDAGSSLMELTRRLIELED
jgi:hypothetical protein